MSDEVILEGMLSVRAALTGHMRPVREVWLDRARRDFETQQLSGLAKAAGARAKFVERAEIARLAEGDTHGGVIALAGPRRHQSLDEVLAAAQDATPFVVMLDGVEDPFNFGQAVRAMWAAGAHGLVLRARNWTSAANIVARASAGASELMPTAVVDDAQHAANFFKSRGLAVAVTAKVKGATSLYDANLAQPLFIVVGGEKRGAQKSLLDSADLRLQIPYGRAFGASLGTGMAAGVIAFEVFRARGARQYAPSSSSRSSLMPK